MLLGLEQFGLSRVIAVRLVGVAGLVNCNFHLNSCVSGGNRACASPDCFSKCIAIAVGEEIGCFTRA